MTEHRLPPDDAAVATQAAPETTATEAYLVAVAVLQDAEAALRELQRRQSAGERLPVAERHEKWSLEEDVEQLRREAERLRLPMEQEQAALDMADVVEVRNAFAPALQQAFADLVAALAVPRQAVEAFLQAHAAKEAALNAMPAFQHIVQQLPAEAVFEPSGREQLANALRTLPNGQDLVAWLLAPTSAPLTVGQVSQMESAHVSATPMQARHLARRLSLQRRG